MKEANIPEYYKADIPYDPNVDKDVLEKSIEKEIKRHFPLWNDITKVTVCIDKYGDHVFRILYGPKKRSEFNQFAGLKLSGIIRTVFEKLSGREVYSMPNGWGHKEDGSEHGYNQLYSRLE